MNVEDCSLHKMTHSEMDDTVTHCDFNTHDVSLLGSNHIHGTANAQHRTCLYTQFCSRFYKLIIKGCGNQLLARKTVWQLFPFCTSGHKDRSTVDESQAIRYLVFHVLKEFQGFR